jgi:hypothetical protein
MFIKLLIISVILISIALAGLAVSMLIKPRGRFPETHISRNREMQKRGIRCAQETDLGCQPGERGGGCEGCSVR